MSEQPQPFSSTSQHPLDNNDGNEVIENDEEQQHQDHDEEEDDLNQTTTTGDGTNHPGPGPSGSNPFGSQYHLGEGRPSFTGSSGLGRFGSNVTGGADSNTQAGGDDHGYHDENNFSADHNHHHHHHHYHYQQQQDLKLPCNVLAPEPLPRDPIDGALRKFPVGFLKFSDAKEIRVVPVGSPDPFLPPRVASQRHSLSEAPVVTGSMDTVLDALLPPRRITVTYLNEAERVEDTVDVAQRVSHAQIKREELRLLRLELDAKLRESNARREGVCNVRRGIHALMFDELIRQVTIDCPERGILLRRIRDEIQMTLDAHHTLYEESVAYSTNRCVAAAKYTPAMTAAIDSLTRDIGELRKELRKLEAKESAMIRCVDEQKNSDHKKYEEERIFLERTKQRLQDQYDAVKEAQEAQRRAAVEEAGLG